MEGLTGWLGGWEVGLIWLCCELGARGRGRVRIKWRRSKMKVRTRMRMRMRMRTQGRGREKCANEDEEEKVAGRVQARASNYHVKKKERVSRKNHKIRQYIFD